MESRGRVNTLLTLAQGNPNDREASAGAHESNFSIWQARAGQDRCGSFGDGRRRCPREPRAPQGPALIIAHYRTCPPTAEKTLSQMHSIAQNILQSFSLLIGSRKASWHITLCDYLSTFFLIENLYECRFAGRRGLGCTDSTRAPRAGPMLRCKSHSPASTEQSHLSVIAKCVRNRVTDHGKERERAHGQETNRKCVAGHGPQQGASQRWSRRTSPALSLHQGPHESVPASPPSPPKATQRGPLTESTGQTVSEVNLSTNPCPFSQQPPAGCPKQSQLRLLQIVVRGTCN